ncbi:NAD-dependent epimerase/dehydratase family protein [Sphingobacterium humi]|nr:NAD-dependent epimerase/dehydratase family protein [Sphingobacterium humi]
MKITITGGSGFVGKNLSAYLSDIGHTVELLSLRDSNWATKYPVDTQVVIHLAGKAHDTTNSIETDNYFKINAELTKSVFQVFRDSTASDFYYFSSVKAVRDSVVGELTENDVPFPMTDYGRSKLEAENYLRQQIISSSKRIFIIRPSMIHGPGNKGNLNLLYNIVKNGIPWPLGSFRNQRSFLGIDNLNFLIGEMLKSPSIQSGVYNFCDDDTLSTNEVVAIISQVLNKKERIWNWSSRLIRFFAKAGDKFSFPLNTERLKKLTESYIVSNAKIKSALNIVKLPFTARENLITTVHSFNKKEA